MTSPPLASGTSAFGLAQALAWPVSDLALRQIRRGHTQLEIARASIGGEPAAVFATVAECNGHDPLDSAALYAYHSATQWGVMGDDDGVTIFNSHWLSDNHWFRLRKISWEELNDRPALRRAFGPDGIATGEAERVASLEKQPTNFLRPVDDELVSRLDSWREEALRFATQPRRVDDKLQTLFAQLFVLRTVEDRMLDPEVPAISTIVTRSDDFDQVAWCSLFGIARARVGSELFDEDVTPAIPPHVVAGVVRDLYRPRGLPMVGATYNFAWLEADVLGAAYEKYLSTVLHPTPPPAQTELFLRPERGAERISVRKQAGVYYTPRFITGYLGARAVDDFYARGAGAKVPPKIIDFACGSGSFLVAAVDQVLKHLKSKDPTRPWAKELIENRHIVGIDADDRAVTAARLHVWQRLAEEPSALPLPKLSDVIIAADGLQRSTWGNLDTQYDIVLGNPPFLATSLIPDRVQLEATFETAKGRFDFSYLFVEQALNVLAEDGRLGMVVPNRLYRNRNGATIRRLLTERADLLTLVDFGSTRPFPDASAYVGCVIARRRASGGNPPDFVRVLEVTALPPDFMAARLLDAEHSIQNNANVGAVRSFWARHPTGEHPWSLLSEAERQSRARLEDSSERLDVIASVSQGIRTGANDFFIFDRLSPGETGLCRAINGLGDSAVLETALLEPVAHGSELQRYQVAEPTRSILYPYRGNRPITEQELEEQYPNTWSYLLRNRDVLAARASLVQSGGKWFELVRPRDEAWLRRPKLMIRDLAPRTSFAVDETGVCFLVGGTAVVPQSPDLLMPLLAYLNSSVVNAMLRQITPQFRGDFQKFEPQHVLQIPVLIRLIEDAAFQARLGDLAQSVVTARAAGAEAIAIAYESEIDHAVAEAAGEHGARAFG